mmetsp:Transcript_110704/g.352624  ORF Transcript_110704/g.352624 Transcript_110704/m.352624 type:complete len:112 (+) Transcript_110704:194-529(+)
MAYIQQLVTIAMAGTEAFREVTAAGGVISVDRQFGVGLYPGYLVADKVRIISNHNDNEQYMWESGAAGTEMVHGEISCGEDTICYSKKEHPDFCSSGSSVPASTSYTSSWT